MKTNQYLYQVVAVKKQEYKTLCYTFNKTKAFSISKQAWDNTTIPDRATTTILIRRFNNREFKTCILYF